TIQDLFLFCVYTRYFTLPKNPMGGIMVNIYINNNKKYKLSYTLVHELTGKGIDIGGRGISKDLNVLLKEN
ncbi:hypothetical protein DIX43_00955, partial [Streptococcus iniae]|uniref:DUF1310 family protein n=1 Tax=Streptococcus iniae TaxID=1346 RepID=UPI000EF7A101